VECEKMWPSLTSLNVIPKKKLKVHILVKFAEKSKTNSSQGGGRRGVTPRKLF
jgi:hypothetical protein